MSGFSSMFSQLLKLFPRTREICGGLRSSEGKLQHLGITAPARSTLAYANRDVRRTPKHLVCVTFPQDRTTRPPP